MSDYVKLTIKVEDPDTGVTYEHVLDRVTDLAAEQTWPEPQRDPSGLVYPGQKASAPTGVSLTFKPLANAAGIWARTHRTGPIDA